MKNISHVLLSLFTLFIAIYSSTVKIGWNPNFISAYVMDTNNFPITNTYNSYYRLLDPMNYLDIYQKQNLHNLLYKFENQAKGIPILLITDSLEPPYNTEEGITKFVEEFIHQILKNDEYYEKRMIVMAFSIKDRLMRISTGSETQKIFSNDYSYELLEEIKPFLRDGKYYDGLKEMCLKMFDKVMAYNKEEKERIKRKKQKEREFKNANKEGVSLSFTGLLIILGIIVLLVILGGKGKKENEGQKENKDVKKGPRNTKGDFSGTSNSW